MLKFTYFWAVQGLLIYVVIQIEKTLEIDKTFVPLFTVAPTVPVYADLHSSF